MASEILVPAFQALLALEQQAADAAGIQLFPFQPRQRPKKDCLWNWIMPAEEGARWLGIGPDHRDTLIVRATIAVVESADDQAVALKLLGYADTFLRVIDPGLNPRMTPMPLGDCVRRAERKGMSTGLHPYGASAPPVLGIDFPIELELDRNTFG